MYNKMGQQEVLDCLKDREWKTNKQIQQEIGISSANVSRSTRILFECGDLQRINISPTGRKDYFKYRLK